MKRILVIAMLAMMSVVAIAAADEAKKEEAAKPTTLTGEVVDLSCYTDHGAKGMDHAKCAQGCITKGMPVGFLTTDGIMYVILGAGHEPANPKLVAFAGKKSTITGTVKDASGLKTIELDTIAEAK